MSISKFLAKSRRGWMSMEDDFSSSAARSSLVRIVAVVMVIVVLVSSFLLGACQQRHLELERPILWRCEHRAIIIILFNQRSLSIKYQFPSYVGRIHTSLRPPQQELQVSRLQALRSER